MSERLSSQLLNKPKFLSFLYIYKIKTQKIRRNLQNKQKQDQIAPQIGQENSK